MIHRDENEFNVSEIKERETEKKIKPEKRKSISKVDNDKTNSKESVKKKTKEINRFDSEKAMAWYGNKKSNDVATPKSLYDILNAEFKFDFDPCPFCHDISKWNGLEIDWKKSNFVNPPYGKEISKWTKKAIVEMRKGNSSVFLITARTSSKYWMETIYRYAKEIRFLKTGVFFEGFDQKCPLPLAIIVYDSKWFLDNMTEIEANKTQVDVECQNPKKKYSWTTVIPQLRKNLH